MRPFIAKIAMLIVLQIVLNGCATQSGLSERETGGIAGAALGAGIGALAGAATGNAGVGTAIGAGAGLLAGAIIGEFARLRKKKIKKEIRQEAMEQQYQPQQYAPQPITIQGAASGQQPVYVQPPVKQDEYTKYNPRTNEKFLSIYTYDPNTGEALKQIQ